MEKEYTKHEILKEMEKDFNKLKTIEEKFSKAKGLI